MFRKLKDKIAEEVKQSPLKLQSSVQQLAQFSPFNRDVLQRSDLNNSKDHSPTQETSNEKDTASETEPSVVTSSSSSVVEPASNDHFTIGDDSEETPQNSPAKDAFHTVDLRDISSPPPASGHRSRRSSTSSVMSDTSLFPIFESSTPTFHLQSDLESASEVDDSSYQLDIVTKEQLLLAYKKMQQRYNKYKGRYVDLARHYREVERENVKSKTILADTQDKALRRIAELKEQCQLEQKAKAHLEELLRNDLEEKDHLISTLQTKIKLLKENGAVESVELQVADKEKPLIDLSPDPASEEQEKVNDANEAAALQERVKRLEEFLNKFKDSLKKMKEKNSQLSQEKEQLEVKLNNKVEDMENLKKSSLEQISALQGELDAAKENLSKVRQCEEEAALSMAETKMQIHQELEKKEEEMKQLKSMLTTLNIDKEELSAKATALQNEMAELKASHEKQLSEVQSQMKKSETSIEEEKQNLIQEFSRGKSEAIRLMQHEMQKKLEAAEKKMNESLKKKEDEWTEEMLKSQQDEEKKHKQQTMEYENKIEALKKEISDCVKEKDNVIKDLEEKLHDSHLTAQKLEEQVEIAENNIKSLTVECDTAQKHVVDLEEKLTQSVHSANALNERLKARNVEVEKQGEEFNKHELTLSELKVKVQELEESLKEAVESKNELQGKLKELESIKQEATEMRAKIGLLEDDLASKCNEAEHLRTKYEQEMSEKAHKVAELESIVEQHQKDISDKDQLVMSLQNDHKNDLEKQQLDLNEYKEKLTNGEGKFNSVVKERDQLKTDNEAKVSQIETMQCEIEALNEALKQTQSKLEEVERSRGKAMKERENILHSLKQNQTVIAELKHQLQILKEETREQVDDVVSIARIANERYEVVAHKFSDAVTSLESLKKQLAEKESGEQELRSRLADLEQQREMEKKSLHSNMEACLESKEKIMQELEEEKRTLLSKVSQSEKEIQMLQQNLNDKCKSDQDKGNCILLLQDALENIKRRMESNISETNNRINSLLDSQSKRLEDNSLKVKMLAESVNNLRQLLTEKSNSERDTSERCESLSSENSDLVARLDVVMSQNTEMSKAMVTIKEENLNRRIKEEEELREELQRSILSLNSALESIRMEKTQLEMELVQTKSSATTLCQELTSSLEVSEESVKKLQEENQNLSTLLKNFDKEMELKELDFDDKMQAAEKEWAGQLEQVSNVQKKELEDVNKKWGEAMEEKEEHISCLKNDILAKERCICDLQFREKELSDLLEKARKDYDNSLLLMGERVRGDIDNMRKDTENLTTELDMLKAQLQASKIAHENSIQHYKQEIANLSNELCKKSDDLNHCKADKATLEDKLKEYEMNNKNMKQEFGIILADSETLRSQCDNLKQVLSELKERNRTLEEETAKQKQVISDIDVIEEEYSRALSIAEANLKQKYVDFLRIFKTETNESLKALRSSLHGLYEMVKDWEDDFSTEFHENQRKCSHLLQQSECLINNLKEEIVMRENLNSSCIEEEKITITLKKDYENFQNLWKKKLKVSHTIWIATLTFLGQRLETLVSEIICTCLAVSDTVSFEQNQQSRVKQCEHVKGEIKELLKLAKQRYEADLKTLLSQFSDETVKQLESVEQCANSNLEAEESTIPVDTDMNLMEVRSEKEDTDDYGRSAESRADEIKTLASKEREIKELKENNKQCEEAWNSKYGELQIKLDEAVQKNISNVDMCKELQCTVDRLSIEKTELEETVSRLSLELEECKLKVSEKTDQEENSRTEVKQLLSEKEKLETQLDETLLALQGKEVQLTKVIENLKTELKCAEDEFTSQLRQLQEETSQRETVDKLTSDNQALRKEVVELMKVKEDFDKMLAEKTSEQEDIHAQKLKQLVKEFERQHATKEEEYETSLSEEIAAKEAEEGYIVTQFREQIEDLQKELVERAEAYERVLEDNKLKVKELATFQKSFNSEITEIKNQHKKELVEQDNRWHTLMEKKLNEKDTHHHREVEELTKEWQWERKNPGTGLAATRPEELECTSQLAVAAVESGTGSIELLHRQLVTQALEMKELKKRHRSEVTELRRLLGMSGSTRSSVMESISLEDATELEYLRNILYEYMMGKEPVVLAKVLAAVVKFNDEQTRNVLQKEEQKQSMSANFWKEKG